MMKKKSLAMGEAGLLVGTSLIFLVCENFQILIMEENINEFDSTFKFINNDGKKFSRKE
jgi:phosphoribosylformylglycinamidine (FGAM) synthase-like amidotransferase family enzyme